MSEEWRKEPWAKENLRKWEALRAQGWKFKKAEPKKNSAGVAMWKEGMDHVISIYEKVYSDTTRQEVYEGWVKTCEKFVNLPLSWVEAAPEMVRKFNKTRLSLGDANDSKVLHERSQ